jgi:thiamine biosynthesis protein ThiS
MKNQIEVIVNGFQEKVEQGATLAELIDRFKEADPGLIVELNCQAVYPQTYETTVVSEGDRVEFIHPNFGG